MYYKYCMEFVKACENWETQEDGMLHWELINPPSGDSNVVKQCEHKFVYLGQRRIKDEYSKTTDMTKLVDVFYCEKCLEYRYI